MHMQIVNYHFPKSNILLRQLASQIPNAIYAKYYLILHSSTSIIISCPRILLNMLVVGPVIPHMVWYKNVNIASRKRQASSRLAECNIWK